MNPEENLVKQNIDLPKAPDPVGSYVACKIIGNLIFISGQVSFDLNGILTSSTGASTCVCAMGQMGARTAAHTPHTHTTHTQYKHSERTNTRG